MERLYVSGKQRASSAGVRTMTYTRASPALSKNVPAFAMPQPWLALVTADAAVINRAMMGSSPPAAVSFVRLSDGVWLLSSWHIVWPQQNHMVTYRGRVCF